MRLEWTGFEANIENIGGEIVGGAFRPFDDQDSAFGCLGQREFGDFFAAAEAIEIGVEEG